VDFIIPPHRSDYAEMTVSLAGVDYEVCEEYARIGRDLRAAGTPIPTNDHWISAIAVRNHLSLMTRDGHFDQIPALEVLHW
jgi:tRNA(fMet)-specific endonuclease VapC